MNIIQNGQTERILITALDENGDFITGLSDVLVEIQRTSDNYYLDFNDNTFKASGWTTRQETMTELYYSYSPGSYYYDFDTTGFSDDEYFIRVTSATAENSPYEGYLKVGGYVDNIDASISTRSTHTADNVKTAIEADGSKIDHIWETTEDDIGVRRFTINALEQAPTAEMSETELHDGLDSYSNKADYKADVSNLDATVSSRSSHSATDVWSVGTRTLTSFGTLIADIWANVSRTLTGIGASGIASEVNATTNKGLIITEIDANETKIDSLDTKIDLITTETDKIKYILGLSQENYRIFSPLYNSSGLLTSGTIRTYQTATDCNNNTNVLASYTITATYSGTNMLTYKVVKAWVEYLL